METLAKDIQTEFPGMRGFSSRNLWLMAAFYIEYQADTFLQSMIAEIGWTHHTIILSKCKDKLSHENDAIGIIICKEKNRTVVEYSLKSSKHPIGVATYSLSSVLPENLRNMLPDSATIAHKIDLFMANLL